VVCALLIITSGATGLFERVMDKLPMAVAAALLAGVLTRFGLDAVLSVRTSPVLVVAMLAAFLAGRRRWPRYAVPGVLVAGIAVAAAQGRVALGGVDWSWAAPVWVTPQFSLSSVVGVALAAVHRHDGLAEPARRGGTAGGGLCHPGVAGDHRPRAWSRWCWHRSARSRSTWRPSPRPSA
jgi:hypothetical protein